ncbi:hypothetical protein G6F48_013381 [Rhizopus delemar]|nr:hypothetical protein G6F48_013381 [Rhizopus delemar]
METCGIDHRLSLPYNPLGNSTNESFVGIAKRALVKRLQGKKDEWNLFLPSIQYAMNCKYSRLHHSRPFVLMYNRQPNEFQDYSNTQSSIPNSSQQYAKALENKLDNMNNIVIPAIRNRIMTTQRIDNGQLALQATMDKS